MKNEQSSKYFYESFYCSQIYFVWFKTIFVLGRSTVQFCAAVVGIFSYIEALDLNLVFANMCNFTKCKY